MIRVFALLFPMLLVQTFAYSKEKLVTAGGTITELVFALGADDQVIAVDQSSMYPPAVRNLPSIGYYRDMSAEGVLSTGLEHLIALEGSGRDVALKQIKAAGVKITQYKKVNSVDGLFALINQLGVDLGKQAKAKALIEEIKASLPQKSEKRQGKALFLLSSGERGIIAAGKETVPQLYFDYLRIENVAKHNGFKGIGIESLAVSQPDILIAPAHSVRSMGGEKKFCAQPQLALLKAAQECNLLIMDSLLALGVTPRLSQGIKQIDEFIEARL